MTAFQRLVILSTLVALGACQAVSYPTDEWTESCRSATGKHLHQSSDSATELLQDTLAQDGGSGISVAVAVNGVIVWSDAFGTANGVDPLTPAGRMRIGSVSKVFTAMIIARLAERGKLDLDAPIETYLPNLPEHLRKITSRQLAQHMSGIRQYDFSSLRDSNNREYYPRLSTAFARHMSDALIAQPGEKYNYSSIGYNLLGIVAEQAYSGTYAEALQELIVEPLALTSTTLDNSHVHTPCRSRFFSLLLGRFKVKTMARDNSDLYPSGGIVSSAEDLARFASSVLNGSLLLPESTEMIIRRVEKTDNDFDYGFGWQVAHTQPPQWVGHGGTINGAYASVRHYPCTNITVAAIANYDFVLTRKRAVFFAAVREELPTLFAALDSCELTPD